MGKVSLSQTSSLGPLTGRDAKSLVAVHGEIGDLQGLFNII